MAPTESRFARMSRRAAITGAALAAMALSACNGCAKGAAEGDMAMGAPEGAKVTVVEYASVTCPHCALWQKNTWPGFKAKYVDTNKVRYVFRELPTPPIDAARAPICTAESTLVPRIANVMAKIPDVIALISVILATIRTMRLGARA